MKKCQIKSWDICDQLHAMNDFGFDSLAMKKRGGVGVVYSRSHTYAAECYAAIDGKKCYRNGKCIKAKLVRESPEG